ncbi:MAG: cation-translocating P-type ATPase [bacterium]|nr:cation-translocating P-type ATPase [bacterium]
MIKNNCQWYKLSTEETVKALNSSNTGLTVDEAQKRLQEYGYNELVKKKQTPAIVLLLKQFANFLIIILLFAVVLSAVLGETVDAVVILIIVVFAVTLGFVQEYKAEKSLEALKKMAAAMVSVLRGNKEISIDAKELVPGDVFIIRTGDKIPADARIISAVNLKVDEAALTGESVSTNKISEPLKGETAIGDRKNMVFMGTAAVYGRGMAIVTGTGMETEFGQIADALQKVERETTPLQKNLDSVGKWIAIGALALCFVLAAIGVTRGHTILEMLIWGVSLAVAAVPESLPAVVTICLAIGMQRMLKRNSLIKKLTAVETLGCTTFICSDKTGTLTQDQMTVRQIYIPGKESPDSKGEGLIDVSGTGYEPKGSFHFHSTKTIVVPDKNKELSLLLRAGSLCNDSSLELTDGNYTIKGDPTEAALVVIAEKAGLSQKDLSAQFPRIREIPFSSETKRMTTVHKSPEGNIAYAKGASEIILNSCKYIFISGKEEILTSEHREKIRAVAHQMANDALRVLGISYKKLSSGNTEKDSEIEHDMVFIGITGMIDPPREEVKAAIALCNKAHIKSVMITGDHKLTAMAIAKELGLLKHGMALSGEELDKISDEEFNNLVEKIEVYARVSPAHKLRVVTALENRGNVVAMTGDGVNDAPALKKADIGIAMGKTGTDVTREVADIILLDDNFASIVAAVEEGRGIFSNIKKFLAYMLSCNIGEVLLMAVVILFGTFLGLPAGIIPLIAIQILFVNLVTDGLPAIALALEPIEKGTMHKRPRGKTESIFNRGVLFYIIVIGIWTAGVSLFTFKWALGKGYSVNDAQGLCFISLMLVQFFNAINCRSLDSSVFKIGFWGNKWLLLAIGFSTSMILAVVYIPALHTIFNTYYLGLKDWIFAVSVSSTVFVIVEIGKLVRGLYKLRLK